MKEFKQKWKQWEILLRSINVFKKHKLSICRYSCWHKWWHQSTVSHLNVALPCLAVCLVAVHQPIEKFVNLLQQYVGHHACLSFVLRTKQMARSACSDLFGGKGVKSVKSGVAEAGGNFASNVHHFLLEGLHFFANRTIPACVFGCFVHKVGEADSLQNISHSFRLKQNTSWDLTKNPASLWRYTSQNFRLSYKPITRF